MCYLLTHSWSSLPLPSDLSSNQENSCPLAAVAFQSFFTKKVEDIRSLTAGSTPPTVLPRTLSKLEGFEEITSEEATIMLRSLPAKTSELDKVPTWLIKDSATVFAPILAKLVNASLSTGILPDAHKLAIIRPRLKKPNLDPGDPSSYRPVSNVSFLSKFVERVVYLQIEKYLSSNDLLPSTQSGFRQGHSTETAVLKVYNDAVIASDKGEVTCLLLLDYSSIRWITTFYWPFWRSHLESPVQFWPGFNHSSLIVIRSSRLGLTDHPWWSSSTAFRRAWS